MVTHGHIKINDRKVDIPSYDVTPGQNIALEAKTLNDPSVLESLTEKKPETLPAWLKREKNIGIVIRVPEKDELRQDVNMSYVMELYS